MTPTWQFYCGGTRAPILIKRISRSASFGLLCLSLFTATTIPSAWSALPKANAAGVISLSLAGSKTISTPGAAAIGIPAGGFPIAGWPGAIWTYTQPAASNVPYSDSQNAIPSSAACEIAARYRCPANCLIAALMTRCRSGRSVRGDLSLSSANRASAALAFASAVSLRNWSPCVVRATIRSAEFRRSFSQYASLTPAIRTMTMVDTTPTTKLPIKNKFAISAIWFATGNDGHIRLPLWFPVGAILIVILAGIAGIFPLLRRRVLSERAACGGKRLGPL